MTDYNTVVEDDKNVCCLNCIYFDERTKFCRFEPPKPIVVTKELNYKNQKFVESKFPVIPMPSLDYCSKYKSVFEELI